MVAVFKHFDDDQASQMGALIAYYGFFSLFPLLLVFVTVLGFVLEGSPSTQESVLHSTLSQFPIIGTQLQNNVHSLKGSVAALAIGLLGATLAGLGITGAAQSAFNKVWDMPTLAPARLSGLACARRGNACRVRPADDRLDGRRRLRDRTDDRRARRARRRGWWRWRPTCCCSSRSFRLLTVAGGAAPATCSRAWLWRPCLWQVLQHVGGFYVEHVVRHAKETSGLFAFVLGLLTWLYLGGQVTLIAAEVNVVRVRRLWPRRLFSDG